MTKFLLLLAVMLSGATIPAQTAGKNSVAQSVASDSVAKSSAASNFKQNPAAQKSLTKSVLHEELEQTLNPTRPTLIFVYSSAYGDHESYANLVESAAQRHEGELSFFKIDTELGHEVANALDVRDDSYALVSFRAIVDPDEDKGFSLSKLSNLYVRDGRFTESELKLFIYDTLKRKGVERDEYLDRLKGSDDFLGKPLVIHMVNEEVSPSPNYRDQEVFAKVARLRSDRATFVQISVPMFSVEDFDSDGKLDGNWLEGSNGNGFVDGKLKLDPTSPAEVAVGYLKRKDGRVRFYPTAVTHFSGTDSWEGFIEGALEGLEKNPVDGVVRRLTDGMIYSLATTKPVLIYFYTTDFGDHDHYLKLFEAAARRHAGRLEFFKMDLDRNSSDYLEFQIESKYALSSYRTQDVMAPLADEFLIEKLSSVSVREGTFTARELEQFIQDTLSGKSAQWVLYFERLEIDRAYSDPLLESDKPVVLQVIDRARERSWMQEYFADMARKFSDKALFMQMESSIFCCDADGRPYGRFVELSGNDEISRELKELKGEEVIVGRLKRINGKLRFYPEQMFNHLRPETWDLLLERAIDSAAAKR